MPRQADHPPKLQYSSTIAALALGFVLIEYGSLLVAGHQFSIYEPLNTAIAIQCLPLLLL